MNTSVVATWPFGLLAVRETAACLERGEDILTSLEKGINVVEDDPRTGECVVGRGGFPNASGILECDAAIMDGSDCRFGAVTAIPGVSTPFSVARLVMEKSSHSMLTGDGAQQFAKDCGITIMDNKDLQTDGSRTAYENFLKTDSGGSQHSSLGHDTIGLIVKDFHGNIAAGTSTSGKPFKHCGRVGDSPLPGAGLYADNEAGAAVATGDGDNIMRFCPCFKVVQLLKQGQTPLEACRRVVKDIWKRVGKHHMFKMALVAMNQKGDIGTASSVNDSSDFFGSGTYPGFAYSLWTSGKESSPEIRCEPPIVWEDIENDDQ